MDSRVSLEKSLSDSDADDLFVSGCLPSESLTAMTSMSQAGAYLARRSIPCVASYRQQHHEALFHSTALLADSLEESSSTRSMNSPGNTSSV
jgi:hypothetical protein